MWEARRGLLCALLLCGVAAFGQPLGQEVTPAFDGGQNPGSSLAVSPAPRRPALSCSCRRRRRRLGRKLAAAASTHLPNCCTVRLPRPAGATEHHPGAGERCATVYTVL